MKGAGAAGRGPGGGDLPAREVADRKPSVEQRMVYQARLQEVRDAIGKLPEKQRAAVLMHKYEEMEYAQIASVLEMLGIGGEEPVVPGLRDVASEACAYGHGRPAMNCPLLEQTDLLLDYTAGRLDSATAALFERHMENCTHCAAFRTEQAVLWNALDAWEPEPVSLSFNRTLWQRIDAIAAEPWYRRLIDGFRFGAWKPALPLAAAVCRDRRRFCPRPR